MQDDLRSEICKKYNLHAAKVKKRKQRITMDSKENRIRKQYSYWFSYHLNHVHFTKSDGLRYPWTSCGDCSEALKRFQYASPTGDFGLLSKQVAFNKHRTAIVRKVSKLKVYELMLSLFSLENHHGWLLC